MKSKDFKGVNGNDCKLKINGVELVNEQTLKVELYAEYDTPVKIVATGLSDARLGKNPNLPDVNSEVVVSITNNFMELNTKAWVKKVNTSLNEGTGVSGFTITLLPIKQ